MELFVDSLGTRPFVFEHVLQPGRSSVILFFSKVVVLAT
jgi:hypothetical protein